MTPDVNGENTSRRAPGGCPSECFPDRYNRDVRIAPEMNWFRLVLMWVTYWEGVGHNIVIIS